MENGKNIEYTNHAINIVKNFSINVGGIKQGQWYVCSNCKKQKEWTLFDRTDEYLMIVGELYGNKEWMDEILLNSDRIPTICKECFKNKQLK